jgi:sugar (pentulose or hexulose) kinase
VQAQELFLGGGGASDPLWKEMLASVLGRRLLVLPDANVSAIGAAFLGGLAVEAYSDSDVEAFGVARNYEETIESETDREAYDEAYERYKEVYSRRTI